MKRFLFFFIISIFFSCEKDDGFRDVFVTIETTYQPNEWASIYVFDLQYNNYGSAYIGGMLGFPINTTNKGTTKTYSVPVGTNLRLVGTASNNTIVTQLWTDITIKAYSDNKVVYSNKFEKGDPVLDGNFLNEIIIIK
jgi:hypothetical protein